MDHLWSKISGSKSKRRVLDFQVSEGLHQRGNASLEKSKRSRREAVTKSTDTVGQKKTFQGVQARNQDGCWSHGPGQGLTRDIVVLPDSTNVRVSGSSSPWLRLESPGQIRRCGEFCGFFLEAQTSGLLNARRVLDSRQSPSAGGGHLSRSPD